MTSAPWNQARQAVLEAARQMAELGLVVGAGGNVSLRIPAETPLVAITPTQRSYKELTPGEVPILSLAGEVVQEGLAPSTEMSLHLEMYRTRADVGAVIHCHPPHATAYAVAGLEIPPIVDELVVLVGGPVRVAEYAFPGTQELASHACRAMGEGNAVLLRNHGLLAVGKDLEETLNVCHLVENTARVFLLAHSVGRAHPLPPEAVEAERELFRRRRAREDS